MQTNLSRILAALKGATVFSNPVPPPALKFENGIPAAKTAISEHTPPAIGTPVDGGGWPKLGSGRKL